jgi:molybdopterin converting factor subunit 1
MKIPVKVRYYAMLKDLSGKTEELVEVAHGEEAGSLYAKLAERYAFPLALDDVRIAVNDEFSSNAHPLQSGDHIVFIPPVAGG